MNNKKKEEEKILTSGFRKRKNKEIANKSFAKQLLKIPRLTSFFASTSNTVQLENINRMLDESANTTEKYSEIEKLNMSNIAKVPLKKAEVKNICHLSEIICEQYPSDFANFKDVITVEEKQFILSVGPCRPEGPFPKDDRNRSFSINYYKKVTKSGISVENTWLCYSPNKNLVYSQPCWLFSSEKKNSGWIRGINDWQGLSKKIKKHEISEQQTFWAKVLERLTKITLKLAKNCSSFRGQNGSLEDIYNGNFLSDVQLLAEYDIVLKEVISLPRGHANYLSPQIQNEIINLSFVKKFKKKNYQ
ncbi:zinc finger MYM-type protein 5-like [Hydra vulgaris]|uniref:zinc finger MYM-type protein 5-like n=1 Tax=Hydra vulgaris TaxID=6087 RepID=UPI0032E9F3B8